MKKSSSIPIVASKEIKILIASTHQVPFSLFHFTHHSWIWTTAEHILLWSREKHTQSQSFNLYFPSALKYFSILKCAWCGISSRDKKPEVSDILIGVMTYINLRFFLISARVSRLCHYGHIIPKYVSTLRMALMSIRIWHQETGPYVV